MSLFYCAIASEKSITCEHPVTNSEYSDIVRSFLGSNPSDGHVYYAEKNVGVHALALGTMRFVALAAIQTPRQQGYQFIDAVAQNFASKTSRLQQAQNGTSMQHSYHHSLESLMKNFDQYKSNLQMAALQSDVEAVTNTLHDNVKELAKRQELASGLVDRTDEMEYSSKLFQHATEKIEKKERCTNIKWKFVIIGVVLAVLVLILLLILWQTGVLTSKK